MTEKQMIFIGGLHRSGTSLLHRILRHHPDVSGFSETGFPEDEGQYLQSVYPVAKEFGGPGKFAFNQASFMDETHPMATAENASKIYEEWSGHWDMSRKCLVEKSPANLVRARFLQALFPGAYFIVILRHPVAISYATQKWSKTSIDSLIDHSLVAYERFAEDYPRLDRVKVLRYEDFVTDPQVQLDRLYRFLGLPSEPLGLSVRTDVNDRYFSFWEKDRKKFINRWIRKIPDSYERRANSFGYSLNSVHELLPIREFQE